MKLDTLSEGDAMARSRNIKPGFFLNDELAEIEPLGRLLFAGLWTVADREGRLKDSPKKIKACVLPYDNCDVNELINELWQKKFIVRYSADGENYIAILNWKKHQNPHIKEVKSDIPGPNDVQIMQEPNEHRTSTIQEQVLHETSPADSLNLIPLTLNLIPDSSTDASTVQKKPKKPKPEIIKKVFGEKVHLSDEQYQKLIQKHGEQGTNQMIEILDNWYCTKGKPPNDSDYHTMIGPGWVLKRFKEDQQKQHGQASQTNRPNSFDAIDQWDKMTEGLIE